MGACFSCKSRKAKEEVLRKDRKRKYLNDFTMVAKKTTSFKEDRLHRNQDRMFLNGSSEIASLFLQKGNKGVNQDAMIVWENFGSRTDTTFCGVFDGHGPYGHMAAKRVRNFLPMKLSEHWEDIRKSGSNSEIFHSVRETFLDVFELTDKVLREDPYFDCVCSGTTAVVMVKQRKCKGHIFGLRDEPRVARVGLPHSNTPCLTMSRVFGDFCLKDYVGISVPEITHTRIIDDDEFVVLATHGVWAVLSNEDVVNIVGTCPTRSYAARAVKEWSYMYPTSKVEDCAVVCLFLNPEESSTAPKEDKAKNYPEPCELNRSDTAKTGCGAIEEG